jgi:hypothetical protein
MKIPDTYVSGIFYANQSFTLPRDLYRISYSNALYALRIPFQSNLARIIAGFCARHLDSNLPELSLSIEIR